MSKRVFYLKYKNNLVGYFVEDGLDYLSYVRNLESSNLPENIKFPVGLYPVYRLRALEKLESYVPSSEDIADWFSDRTFPQERPNAETLLRNLGLEEYNLWEIMKATKAVSLDDYFWISEDYNEKYENVHPRHSIESPKVKTVVSSKEQANTVSIQFNEGSSLSMILKGMSFPRNMFVSIDATERIGKFSLPYERFYKSMSERHRELFGATKRLTQLPKDTDITKHMRKFLETQHAINSQLNYLNALNSIEVMCTFYDLSVPVTYYSSEEGTVVRKTLENPKVILEIKNKEVSDTDTETREKLANTILKSSCEEVLNFSDTEEELADHVVLSTKVSAHRTRRPSIAKNISKKAEIEHTNIKETLKNSSDF